MTADWQAGGFGLYVHWPFCEAKCPYCDFNSHVVASIDQDAWRAAYIAELDRAAALTGSRVLQSIFFGGGTPSLMDPETIASVIGHAKSLWTPANDIEITLEANPSSVEAARFAAYRSAGVDRVSIGLQALNDPDLRRLGRLHSAKEALQAIAIARDTFERVSFDLIYARQDQTLSDWKAELSQALDLGTDHLSLYQLTVEDGTAFGDRYKAGKLRGLPNDDLAADMYDLTQELCDDAGLAAYEVSNHARTGAASRHNLIYWRYGDYVGIGPGAHGRLSLPQGRQASEAIMMPGAWMKAVRAAEDATRYTALSGPEQGAEYLMMSMRLQEGSDLRRYASLAGAPVAEEAIDRLTALGMVERKSDVLRATDQGRKLLNAVLRDLLPD